MIKKLQNNNLYIIELLVLLALALFPIINSRFITGMEKLPFTLSILTVIVISLFFFAFLYKKNNLKPEKIFLLIILVVGPLYMFSLPLNQIPDEGTHAGRIYEISTGHLTSKKFDDVTTGRKLDSAIYPVLQNNRNYNDYYEKIDVEESNNKSIYRFNNTALYSFICYIPQVMGILISNIFTDNILIQLLFARLFNFLAYTILLYYAIKLLPMKKELLFLVGLLPLSIQEAVSLSPDSLTISTSALLISFIFYLRSNKVKVISKKHIAIIAGLSLLISQCKIVYLPLCLLLFLIPSDKFKSLKQKNIICFSIIFIIGIISLIWLKIAGSYLPDGVGGIDSSKQLENILSNPIKYLYIIFVTFNYNTVDYLFETFGGSLSLLNINITKIFILINIIMFILISICNYKEKERISKSIKWFIGILLIGIITLICTSLYLQWTPVNDPLIKGIQGRYFIPLLLLIGLLFYNKQINIKNTIFNKYFILFIVMEHLCVLSTIFYQFV